MVQVILTGHGEVAAGLASGLEMISGYQENLKVLNFVSGHEGEYPRLLSDAVKKATTHADSVLILCDLFGGTPCNQALIASHGHDDVHVVTGVNLPMLLEVFSLMNVFSTAEYLAEVARNAGNTGIVSPKLHLDLDDDSE